MVLRDGRWNQCFLVFDLSEHFYQPEDEVTESKVKLMHPRKDAPQKSNDALFFAHSSFPKHRPPFERILLGERTPCAALEKYDKELTSSGLGR